MKCERCGKKSKRLLYTQAKMLDPERSGYAGVCVECSKAIDDTTSGAGQRLREALIQLWEAIAAAVRGAA